MKKLFSYSNDYLSRSDWKDLALLKLCLSAFGVLIGLKIPEKRRRCASLWARVIFVAAYIPLMKKFFSVVKKDFSCCETNAE